MVQAAAVVVIVLIKRIHDDSVHKERPPARWIYTVMHYLKYPFLLYHIDYKNGEEKYYGSQNVRVYPVVPNNNGCHVSPKALEKKHSVRYCIFNLALWKAMRSKDSFNINLEIT